MTEIEYREVFEKAEVGIALNDPDTGTIGQVNQHYADLMGYTPRELETMEIEAISGDDPSFDQAAAMEKIQRALDGEPQRFDWLFERKDDTTFWGEVVLKRANLGTTDCLLAFVRDISSRKRYEAELERQNEQLDEFASIVSHDLRNPLNVASGRLELAKEDCNSEHYAAIEEALDRMDTLINDVLTLARSGTLNFSTGPVDIAALATACWDTIQPDDGVLAVESRVMVVADASRLRQLLENLFQNAVDHAGPDVTISVGGLDDSDGFYVADDGPGIPADERDRVFEAGYSTRSDGVGFGLRVVELVADAHGWDIDVTASERGGARFEFSNVTHP